MDTSWKSLEKIVHPLVMKGIEGFNFKNMTAVQAACIPQLVNYKDVAAEAVTGSGKTLAFLVPVLHILLRREEKWKLHEVGAIIIAPTRELAFQIKEVLAKLLEGIPSLRHVLFIGGTHIQSDVEDFVTKGANIIIATPGRLEDLLLRREDSRIAFAVKHLEVLILDEADCLLNLGFEKSLNTILRLLPKQRRTGLFSATQTTEVMKLIRAGLRNPVSVVVRDNESKGRVPSTLENFYSIVEPEKKLLTLIEFLKQERTKKFLIFFSTCACVEYFSMILPRLLQKSDITNIKSIHGKMKDKQRFSIFNKFRESATGILCCTDVMARGIDITQRIDWVIQFDPPSHPASFVHRAGRTARNGDEGKALLFLMPSEMDYISYIKVSEKVEVAPISLDHLNVSEENLDLLTKLLRKFQLKDRIYYDKAMRAFVSYYKAYTKYDCHLILRHKDLNLARTADCFGLLKFPKMSELDGKKPDDFVETSVNLNSIHYSDKQKESIRKKNLKVFKETGAWPEKKGEQSQRRKHLLLKDTAWSNEKERRAKRKDKVIKKLSKKRQRNALTLEEFEELEKDDALVKKLKRKKISDADFDEEIGLTAEDGYACDN